MGTVVNDSIHIEVQIVDHRRFTDISGLVQ